MGWVAILTPWWGSGKPVFMVLRGAWGPGAPHWVSDQLSEEQDLLGSARATRSSSSRDARGARARPAQP